MIAAGIITGLLIAAGGMLMRAAWHLSGRMDARAGVATIGAGIMLILVAGVLSIS